MTKGPEAAQEKGLIHGDIKDEEAKLNRQLRKTQN
jgi:hypothetical protein